MKKTNNYAQTKLALPRKLEQCHINVRSLSLEPTLANQSNRTLLRHKEDELVQSFLPFWFYKD